jgi:hypothetical protein
VKERVFVETASFVPDHRKGACGANPWHWRGKCGGDLPKRRVSGKAAILKMKILLLQRGAILTLMIPSRPKFSLLRKENQALLRARIAKDKSRTLCCISKGDAPISVALNII